MRERVVVNQYRVLNFQVKRFGFLYALITSQKANGALPDSDTLLAISSTSRPHGMWAEHAWRNA